MIPQGPWLANPVVFDDPDRMLAIRSLCGTYRVLPWDQTEAFLDYLAEVTGAGRASVSGASGMWMTWDMVREMKANGMTIGGHTVNHPILARLPGKQQEKEIAECRQRLETELGGSMSCFSYPNGGKESVTEYTRGCLRSQGVEFAFSYYGGFRRFDDWD